MRPPLLFLLAILTPIVLCCTLLLPIYGSLFGAAYLIYAPDAGPHPLMERALDVFYITDVYGQLFDYWTAHMGTVSFVDYTLPVIGLPLLGIFLSLWITYKIAATMLNIFRLTTSL